MNLRSEIDRCGLIVRVDGCWQPTEREIFIDNLLVRVHWIIEMSRPALRHGSLNSLFQVVLYLPSWQPTRSSGARRKRSKRAAKPLLTRFALSLSPSLSLSLSLSIPLSLSLSRSLFPLSRLLLIRLGARLLARTADGPVCPDALFFFLISLKSTVE